MPIRRKRSSVWNNGRITHIPRATTERKEVVTKQAEKDFKPTTEESIGIMRARELVLEAGLTIAQLETALNNHAIDGAERQGARWFISPSSLQSWIAGPH